MDDEYRGLFKHYSAWSEKDPADEARKSGLDVEWFQRRRDQYKARVAGGFDAFVEEWRQRRIAWFETACEQGAFEVKLLRWLKPGQVVHDVHRTLSLPSHRYRDGDHTSLHEGGRFGVAWTKVVPVETETTIPVAQRYAKMSKKAQRELLGLVCDKMIDQQKWDEIALLLTTYLEGDAPLVLKLLGGQR